MQVNKSQGDSLKCVGIWLPKPVFAHGQAYVAPSRVGSVQQCHYAIRPVDNHSNQTANVVFREVLEESSDIHEDEAMEVEVEAVADEVEEVGAAVQEVGELMEVDDISLWTDYDIEDTSFDDDLDLEEYGTPDQGLVVRRAVTRSPPVSLSCSQPKNMGPVYKTVPRPKAPMKILPPLPVVPLCPYEVIRKNNIAERTAKWLSLTLAMAAGEEEDGEEGDQLWEGDGEE